MRTTFALAPPCWLCLYTVTTRSLCFSNRSLCTCPPADAAREAAARLMRERQATADQMAEGAKNDREAVNADADRLRQEREKYKGEQEALRKEKEGLQKEKEELKREKDKLDAELKATKADLEKVCVCILCFAYDCFSAVWQGDCMHGMVMGAEGEGCGTEGCQGRPRLAALLSAVDCGMKCADGTGGGGKDKPNAELQGVTWTGSVCG